MLGGKLFPPLKRSIISERLSFFHASQFRQQPPPSPLLIETHKIFNAPQSDLRDYDAFSCDPLLTNVLHQAHAGAAAGPGSLLDQDLSQCTSFGQATGSGGYQEMAEEANRFPPELQLIDRFGRRINRVRFHPSYHRLMELSLQHRVHSWSWPESQLPAPGSLTARCALLYMLNQAEASHSCPITMTFAGVPSLRKLADPGRRAEWLSKVCAGAYDPRDLHISLKGAATVGMALTEKQGGSDVRANTTTATHVDRDAYSIVGHKFFMSAPMCDGFLTLAKTPEGISCFLVPRWTNPGERNAGLQLQRLKNKLGNHANASSEVEYRGAIGYLIGVPGKGIAAIMEMVAHTRLDCALGSAGQMRMAVLQARHFAEHRSAFGRRLIEQPLMRNTLADLCLESEASSALAFLVVDAFGRSPQLARVLTPVAKYFVCKRAPSVVLEALECLGGPGYVDDAGNMLPRLYRDSPLNSIWEGCGNIQALDVLRAFATSGKGKGKDASLLPPLAELLHSASGHDALYDQFVATALAQVGAIAHALALESHASPSGSFQPSDALQFGARSLTLSLALALQAVSLFKFAPQLFPLYCSSRLSAAPSRTIVFGTLGPSMDDSISLLLHRADARLFSTIASPAFSPISASSSCSLPDGDCVAASPSESSPPADSDPVWQLFQSFDSNHDGLLSAEELRAGMVTLGESFTDDEISAALKEADLDGNQYIDFEEFKRMMGL